MAWSRLSQRQYQQQQQHRQLEVLQRQWQEVRRQWHQQQKLQEQQKQNIQTETKNNGVRDQAVMRKSCVHDCRKQLAMNKAWIWYPWLIAETFFGIPGPNL